MIFTPSPDNISNSQIELSHDRFSFNPPGNHFSTTHPSDQIRCLMTTHIDNHLHQFDQAGQPRSRLVLNGPSFIYPEPAAVSQISFHNNREEPFGHFHHSRSSQRLVLLSMRQWNDTWQETSDSLRTLIGKARWGYEYTREQPRHVSIQLRIDLRWLLKNLHERNSLCIRLFNTEMGSFVWFIIIMNALPFEKSLCQDET